MKATKIQAERLLDSAEDTLIVAASLNQSAGLRADSDESLPSGSPTTHMARKLHPDESLFYLMRRVLDLARREIDRQLEPQDLTNAQWVPMFKLFMKQAR